MLPSTLNRLRCPCCAEPLKLEALEVSQGPLAGDVRRGTLHCSRCRLAYPILAGVALLVEDVHSYLLNHVKGISKLVADEEIPEEYREDFVQAREEIPVEHIEEDLEAERVNALYVMTHYLRADKPGTDTWWRPVSGEGEGSPLIDSLVREHWDRGPFSVIRGWVESLPGRSMVELGCGVGGLHAVVRERVQDYLGVDSAFASIALARHLALGAPYPASLRIPGDLLQGTVSRDPGLVPTTPDSQGGADFVVAEADRLPLALGEWDIAVALNMIDMLDDPSLLPRMQRELLRPGGIAIQSSPYVWHEGVAAGLREILPETIRDSARAAEWLYEQEGFKIQRRQDQVPWLFFKHLRQLEIYSVHLLLAEKLA